MTTDLAFAYRIADYLIALVSAYRTLSDEHRQRAAGCWKLMSPAERITAISILEVTGPEAWR